MTQRSVVFETPGLIDIRSFTRFGVNSKPLTVSPLGYFGTGLKYAIAVLVREGLEVKLYIGKDQYNFYRKKESFRDKDFDFVRMKKLSWMNLSWGRASYEALPFTTELGKTWKLWQAFRELYTNTIDEDGTTYVHDDTIYDDEMKGTTPRVNITRIVVTGEAFVNEYYDKDRNFLPDGLRQRDSTDPIQVFDRPSNHIYYRGMRVLDLDKPSTLTYNFLTDVELTEDRTAASPYRLQEEIARYILSVEDAQRVKKVVESKNSYESNINYTWAYRAPSTTFRDVVRGNSAASHAAATVGRAYEPRKVIENPLSKHPRPWVTQVDGGHSWVVDSSGNTIMRFTEDLSTEAVRYIMALLNKDLTDEEVDVWIRERPQDLAITDPHLSQKYEKTIKANDELVCDEEVPF